MLTLVASALAGGDCIDDADVLRTGSTARVLGCAVKAPSTLGTFLRSFRWGHVRQLDRVSRELLARAWAAGAGPGDEPLTIDLDSTVCETYGLGKEGARRHGYTGQRGYHPLLAVAAERADRQGRANTARGADHCNFNRNRSAELFISRYPTRPVPLRIYSKGTSQARYTCSSTLSKLVVIAKLGKRSGRRYTGPLIALGSFMRRLCCTRSTMSRLAIVFANRSAASSKA